MVSKALQNVTSLFPCWTGLTEDASVCLFLQRICQKDSMVPIKHHITQTFISKHSAVQAVFTDDSPSYHL